MAQSASQTPSVGRIVQYTLGEADIARRGAHIGNPAHAGDVFPLLITGVKPEGKTPTISGQVFLDGNDTLWVAFVPEGTGPHTFAWPSLK